MRRVYPSDVFPGAWDKLDELANVGFIVSIDEVVEELRFEDDEVLEWAKSHADVFLPLDAEIQTLVKYILSDHPELVDLKRRKSGADPFLIACAILNSCSVVTQEKRSGGPPKKKIPDVCAALEVECIPILEMFRREGLRLR